MDADIKAGYIREAYRSLYGKQPFIHVVSILKHNKHLKIMTIERFGYNIVFKSPPPARRVRRKQTVDRIDFNPEIRQQNKYRMMNHGR